LFFFLQSKVPIRCSTRRNGRRGRAVMLTLFRKLRALSQAFHDIPSTSIFTHECSSSVTVFPSHVSLTFPGYMFHWPAACTSVGRRLIPKEMYCGHCTEASFAHCFIARSKPPAKSVCSAY